MEQVFGPQGLLAHCLPGYEFRSEQLCMSQGMQQALAQGGILLVEAGTGTGKTLAYLIPAILSGRKLVISTGTKNLQEQLYFKDIPFLSQNLELDFSVCYMKGRNNYLCQRRFAEFLKAPQLAINQEAHYLELIQHWAVNTQSGDRAELDELPDSCRIWQDICSKSELCWGQNCHYFEDCFITRMKQQAMRADLVIVNHHLFFADLAIKGRGGGGVIPRCSGVIFDEAHQLEEVATRYFGLSVSNYRLEELARDTQRELLAADKLDKQLTQVLESITTRTPNLFSQFKKAAEKYRLKAPPYNPQINKTYAQLDNVLELLRAKLENLPTSSEGLAACTRRAKEIRAALGFILGQADSEYVYWCEQRGVGVYLRASPVDISAEFGQLGNKLSSIALTSATLSTQGNFSFIKRRLGIERAQELILTSHFDYTQQALIYIPRGLPPPPSPHFITAAAQEIYAILLKTQGRALVLFTSFNYLEQIYSRLKGRLPYTLLKQGERAKAALMREFRQDTHSVLLATSSFWEGVDIPGEALSCVIVDRLPFDVPSEPLIQARIEHIKTQGGNPFLEYQVPMAIISLKQGFGRLIRNRQDRGVLVLLDSRVLHRHYGRMFLASLPPCRLSHKIQDLEGIFPATEQNGRET